MTARTLTFATLNTHLWGQTGMVHNKATGLNYYDDSRAALLAARLRTLPTVPDVLCLQEVWDRRYRELLEGRLGDIYPYHCHSPEANGISDVLAQMKRLHPITHLLLRSRVEWAVRAFAQSHYDVADSMWVGFLRVLFPKEDRFLAFFSEMLEKPKAWGGGLVILSRHPIDQKAEPPQFTLHPAAADLERFAAKGVLKAVVRPPDMPPIRVLTTHLQEGHSEDATKARHLQLRGIHDLIPPKQIAVVLGDLNAVAESLGTKRHPSGVLQPTEEYLRMRRTLDRGLRDAFREAYPNPVEEPGATYDHTGPFAGRLGVSDAPGRAVQRLDYILHTLHFGTEVAHVDREHLRFRDHYLSDHFLLSAKLFLK